MDETKATHLLATSLFVVSSLGFFFTSRLLLFGTCDRLNFVLVLFKRLLHLIKPGPFATVELLELFLRSRLHLTVLLPYNIQGE